jgi:hypothetical protein
MQITQHPRDLTLFNQPISPPPWPHHTHKPRINYQINSCFSDENGQLGSSLLLLSNVSKTHSNNVGPKHIHSIIRRPKAFSIYINDLDNGP